MEEKEFDFNKYIDSLKEIPNKEDKEKLKELHKKRIKEVEKRKNYFINNLEYFKIFEDIFKFNKTLNIIPKDNVHDFCSFICKIYKLDDCCINLFTLSSLYLIEFRPIEEQYFNCVFGLITTAIPDNNSSLSKAPLDRIFKEAAKENPNALSILFYEKYKMQTKEAKQIAVKQLQNLLKDIKYPIPALPNAIELFQAIQQDLASQASTSKYDWTFPYIIFIVLFFLTIFV